MLEDNCLAEIDKAALALQYARGVMVHALAMSADSPGATRAESAMAAMAALEAARSARVSIAKVIMSLTAQSLRMGASFKALGFDFTDPYE